MDIAATGINIVGINDRYLHILVIQPVYYYISSLSYVFAGETSNCDVYYGVQVINCVASESHRCIFPGRDESVIYADSSNYFSNIVTLIEGTVSLRNVIHFSNYMDDKIFHLDMDYSYRYLVIISSVVFINVVH